MHFQVENHCPECLTDVIADLIIPWQFWDVGLCNTIKLHTEGETTYFLIYLMTYIILRSALLTLYRMSKKSVTNGNFNYFSYFYLQVKVKG
jgi:hypothetical protein